ncbi:HAD-IB family hydrolase [Streptomyces sp. SP17BM10]|uniref:HAD-IB family hydrolase n=1 Tax=Streptomyces sp. SP17BM10 TaxID=3002530 RepID=UPI002E77CF30|nr:HAD-IB family hydrolase [Streptomyces sp. SP17BM10]MEE1784151.1 HAD-IB family hydrolase [Streptomyces sp. SP17BM10]
MTTIPRPAAFFDVDGTLTTTTTMFGFLAHHMAARGRAADAEALRGRLRAMTAAGADRAEACREYYRVYRGIEESVLLAEGESWFRERRADPGFFNAPALAAFRAHARAGDLTVLVSGSFPACLAPLAEHLGADVVLCSRPQVRDGVCTGTVAAPMIGEHKAAAVRALADERRLSLADSHAYGDHLSDVPLLELVGTPVVVGDDPGMRRLAAARGWRRLEDVPSAAGRLPAWGSAAGWLPAGWLPSGSHR